ncbi:MAG: ABC transporter permease [Candidatus Enterosoma sp.]|nr:ABC transporter permease [Candidatus Enterosoma sp.]
MNTDYKTLTVDKGSYFQKITYQDKQLFQMWKDTDYNCFSTDNLGLFSINDKSYSLEGKGVSKLSKKMLLPSFTIRGATERTELIYGDISNYDESDSFKSIYLYESVAKIIFNDVKTCLNEQIKTNTSTGSKIYIVKGVFSDSLDLKKYLDEQNLTNKDYISLPVLYSNKKMSRVDTSLIFFSHDISTELLGNLKKDIQESRYAGVELSALSQMIFEHTKAYETSRRIESISLTASSIILCLISIIILFLLLKKRVVEIGIRKSFGANNSDITCMFLKENLVSLLCSIFYATPISIFIYIYLSVTVLKNSSVLLFPLDYKMILLPVFLISSLILISSFIFSLYFSNKKISDCLKE